MALLEIEDITKSYKEVMALAGVSLSVSQGELVAIIGPSGAGKSTLLRCINRLVDASSGRITFDGTDMLRLPKRQLRKVRARIGMIFQHYNLVPRLTVIENVLHGRLGYKSDLDGVFGRYSEDEKEAAVGVISRLGLMAQIYQRCDTLSGGQKQRVGIARALVQNPRLILCDEPIASLDPGAAKVIMDYLADISRELGITVVVNLHQLDVAVKYAARVVGINSGRIVYDGPPGTLSRRRVYDIYGTEAGDLVTD